MLIILRLTNPLNEFKFVDGERNYIKNSLSRCRTRDNRFMDGTKDLFNLTGLTSDEP